MTGGHPENSDISTATTSAFYSGGGFYVSSGWTYDLRLIRGLACHNMVEANGYIYIFGGQVTKGTDQKLMFKRSVEDRIDDVPDTVELKNGAVVGSINGYGDVDSFTITPKKDINLFFLDHIHIGTDSNLVLNMVISNSVYIMTKEELINTHMV